VFTRDFGELSAPKNHMTTENAHRRLETMGSDDSQIKMTEDDPELVKSILDAELQRKFYQVGLGEGYPYKGENPQMANLKFEDLILKFTKICGKFMRSEAVYNVNFKRKLLQTLGHFSKMMQVGVFLEFMDRECLNKVVRKLI
jgi:hypothetical protein